MNMSELARRQRIFTRCFARFLTFALSIPGIEITLSEGYVGDTDAADGDYDGPHVKGGCHYAKLAIDINLFDNGIWITNGDDPIYKRLGAYWKALDPLCRWGGDFKKKDSNHFSVAHPDGIHE